jgi:hypothetical protein
LGWFILDYWKVCAWRRERAKVLGILRDAITEYGPRHMSDPYVQARALMARESAARVLQEGGAVRLRGPTAAGEHGGSSYNSRLSVASSSVALGHVVPGVPRGARGVIVRGKDGQAKYLVANGFTYRHLTPDLRVHVLFPHGQRTVPADWLTAGRGARRRHLPYTANSSLRKRRFSTSTARSGMEADPGDTRKAVARAAEKKR